MAQFPRLGHRVVNHTSTRIVPDRLAVAPEERLGSIVLPRKPAPPSKSCSAKGKRERSERRRDAAIAAATRRLGVSTRTPALKYSEVVGCSWTSEARRAPRVAVVTVACAVAQFAVLPASTAPIQPPAAAVGCLGLVGYGHNAGKGRSIPSSRPHASCGLLASTPALSASWAPLDAARRKEVRRQVDEPLKLILPFPHVQLDPAVREVVAFVGRWASGAGRQRERGHAPNLAADLREEAEGLLSDGSGRHHQQRVGTAHLSEGVAEGDDALSIRVGCEQCDERTPPPPLAARRLWQRGALHRPPLPALPLPARSFEVGFLRWRPVE
eukprot:scaffold157075_cov31-Tisochrysis_lutea.AAC.3